MKKWIGILALCAAPVACTFDESELLQAKDAMSAPDAGTDIAGVADARPATVDMAQAADALPTVDVRSVVVPDATSVADRVSAQDAPCAQAAPTGVNATAGNRQVTLAWIAAAGAVSYDIRRSTIPGAGYVSAGTATATVPTGAFVDNGTALVNGTRYYYVISASNGTCTSSNSIEVSAVPLAPDAGTAVADAPLVVDLAPVGLPDAAPVVDLAPTSDLQGLVVIDARRDDAGRVLCPDRDAGAYGGGTGAACPGFANCWPATLDGVPVGPCWRVITYPPSTLTVTHWYVPDCSQCPSGA